MSVVEELAERLWVARQRAQPLAVDGNWLGVDHRKALEIADLLYRRCSVPPDPREVAAWKLGALDEPTQSRLGLPGPLFAPVLPDRLHTDVTAVPVRLAELVDPKLEAEIGIRLDADGLRLAPCVEIADCRFAGWALPPGGAPADFGLQGSMVFGPVVEPVTEVHVEVRRDGETVGAGAGDVGGGDGAAVAAPRVVGARSPRGDRLDHGHVPGRARPLGVRLRARRGARAGPGLSRSLIDEPLPRASRLARLSTIRIELFQMVDT